MPEQSMLHPAGPAAAAIAWLWWVMFAAFTAVFVLVILLLLRAILLRRTRPLAPEVGEHDPGTTPPWGRTGFIVAGGVIFPIVVLTPLYIMSLRVSADLRIPDDALSISVVGHMWWWEVRYPEQGIITANEIHIPAGRPVRLKLTSADVIHSFWVPRLNGKRDMIPGIVNDFWIQADEPGVYRGQCGEYCGTQHANMAFLVIALPPKDFDAWLADTSEKGEPGASATGVTHGKLKATPVADAPGSPKAILFPQPPQGESDPVKQVQRRGAQVFMTAGCAQCHVIRGTAAKGNVGPDLTHMGSRRTIGAATLPNTRGNLAGWIADPQAIKPGVKMPRSFLAADDLQALVTYLEELK